MKRRLIVVGLLIAAIALAIALIVPQVRSVNILATHSAAAQLQQDLDKSEQGDDFADDWKVLSDAEYDSFLLSFTNAGGSFDAPARWKTSDGNLVDAWGQRFQIAARRKDGRRGEFIVWSKGPDGRSGTDDDIVVPENRSAEVRKFARVAPDQKGDAP